MKPNKKFGFGKFIRKTEGKPEPKRYCDKPPLLIWNTNNLEKALKGNKNALAECFPFDKTPQGHDFWFNKYDKGLSQEGEAFLQYLLKRAPKGTHIDILISLSEWEVTNEN